MGALLANWFNYECVRFTACVLPKSCMSRNGPYVDENLAFFFQNESKIIIMCVFHPSQL